MVDIADLSPRLTPMFVGALPINSPALLNTCTTKANCGAAHAVACLHAFIVFAGKKGIKPLSSYSQNAFDTSILLCELA